LADDAEDGLETLPSACSMTVLQATAWRIRMLGIGLKRMPLF